jgi:hypothetical protein
MIAPKIFGIPHVMGEYLVETDRVFLWKRGTLEEVLFNTAIRQAKRCCRKRATSIYNTL